MKNLSVALCALSFMLPWVAMAQKTVPVQLQSDGKATVMGSVRGRNYVDHLVKVGAGQTLAVHLRSASHSVFFNVNPPASDFSLFIGSTNGAHFSARPMPMAGNYIVRVYQMGAAASDGKQGNYTLVIAVRGTALKPVSSRLDARLPGTPFHAKSIAKCSLSLDPSRTQCDAYVIRYGSGSATIEFRAGRNVRRVLILKGKPYAHDSAMAFTYEIDGGMFTVRFGDNGEESYTFPDSLVTGG